VAVCDRQGAGEVLVTDKVKCGARQIPAFRGSELAAALGGILLNEETHPLDEERDLFLVVLGPLAMRSVVP